MNIKKLFVVATLALSYTTSYACTAPGPQDYKALMAATGFVQINFASKLVNTYCYDLNTYNFSKANLEHPIFFSPNIDFLKFYTTNSRDVTQYKSKESGLDVLSKLLISPYASYYVSNPKQQEEYINFVKRYDSSANLSWYNNVYQTIDNDQKKYMNADVMNNRAKMINFLLPYYDRAALLPKDKFDNSPLYYSMVTNEYKVFTRLAEVDDDFYKTNKDGFTLFHLAFAKHMYLGNKQDGEDNLKRINTILVKNFKPEYLSYLGVKNIPFEYFIELFKDNNVDLYTRLKAKINEQNPVPVHSVYLTAYSARKDYLNLLMNYIDKLD